MVIIGDTGQQWPGQVAGERRGANFVTLLLQWPPPGHLLAPPAPLAAPGLCHHHTVIAALVSTFTLN